MVSKVVVLALTMLPLAAVAADRDGASGLPQLERALEGAGWQLTPERSATYTVGDIYRLGENRPVVFGTDCFSGEAREGVYTSLEVVQAMKAGGKVPLGMARLRADGMQYKQLTFAEPYVRELSDMQLAPSEACVSYLAGQQASGLDLAQLYVVQAVLSAEVKEQLCRELEAGASMLGAEVSAGVSEQCVQGSEGHVAVAFKTRTVPDLLQSTGHGELVEKASRPAAASRASSPPAPTRDRKAERQAAKAEKERVAQERLAAVQAAAKLAEAAAAPEPEPTPVVPQPDPAVLQAAASLGRTAESLVEQGQLGEALETSREALELAPTAPDAWTHQVRIVEVAAKQGDAVTRLAEVKRLAQSFGEDSAWALANASNPEQLRGANEATDKQLRNTAVDLHLEGRKGNSALLPMAAEAYSLYLSNYPDSSKVYDVRYAYGELLYDLKDFAGAYDQYMAVVALDPRGKHSKFVAESAVYAAEELMSGEGSPPGAGPLTPGEQRFVDACEQLGRLYPEDDKAKGVAYKAAYLAYDREQFEISTKVFLTAIALEPGAREAEQAAMLILDTLAGEERLELLRDTAKALHDMPGLGDSKLREEIGLIHDAAAQRVSAGAGSP